MFVGGFGVQMIACKWFHVFWCENVCFLMVPGVWVIKYLLVGSFRSFGVEIFVCRWFQVSWYANVCLSVVPGVLVC